MARTWLGILGDFLRAEHVRVDEVIVTVYRQRICPMCGDLYSGDGSVCDECDTRLLPFSEPLDEDYE